MTKSRKLNADGIAAFKRWLENPVGMLPPAELLNGEAYTEEFADYDIDESREFLSRLEFGIYLNECFSGADFNALLSPDSDGFWAWLSLFYFQQLSSKKSDGPSIMLLSAKALPVLLRIAMRQERHMNLFIFMASVLRSV